MHCLPGNPQEQGQAPEGRAQRPPPSRVHVEDLGVSSPGNVLTGVVQLVGQVAQDRYTADKDIVFLQDQEGGGWAWGGTYPLPILGAQTMPTKTLHFF